MGLLAESTFINEDRDPVFFRGFFKAWPGDLFPAPDGFPVALDGAGGRGLTVPGNLPRKRPTWSG